MTSAQEFLHWLEVGRGKQALRIAAIVAVTLALSFLLVWKQFHGPQTEATLEQADVGRQLAKGEGFTTLVNYPQSVAVLNSRGRHFTPNAPLPELHHPPLYSLAIGGALRLVPAATRARLFAMPEQLTDGYGGDYFLLGLNLVLLWLAAFLTYRLGCEFFEPRVGALAAFALLASLPIWQQTLALNGTTLLMVLALLAFLAWRRVEVLTDALERGNREGAADIGEDPAAAEPRLLRWRYGWLGLLGMVSGLLFLTEYTAGVLVLVAIGYVAIRFRGRARFLGIAAAAAGFAIVAGPWMARNGALTGHPVALAAGDIALKAGDPTAEPASLRASLSAEAPRIDLRKLGNKTLTALQENVKARLWSGGAMWLVAFFVAGWLYSFRSPVTNRLRWIFTASFGVLVLAQAALNSGETDRLAVTWLAPLIAIFGAGFFFVLLGSNAVLGAWPRLAAAALLAVQALPLVHDALAPAPYVRFQYPPYFPALLRGMRTELEQRNATPQFGAMADLPAGVAWYGTVRTWAQPQTLKDFYAVTLEQPIGELLLTPRTLDRPFFTELNAHSVVPGALSAVPNRFGEWGEIYAGLVTGTLPREFPLKVTHKIAENLFVLENPALPARRGK